MGNGGLFKRDNGRAFRKRYRTRTAADCHFLWMVGREILMRGNGGDIACREEETDAPWLIFFLVLVEWPERGFCRARVMEHGK